MTTQTKHAHIWKIEEARGPTSKGRCECGATKEFHNSWNAPNNPNLRDEPSHYPLIGRAKVTTAR